MKVGIGITVHNRSEVAHNTIQHIIGTVRDLAVQPKIVIVDDASDVPYYGATFRFDSNVGIAQAKNKCLEQLQDCEHIFLFDDDCIPTANPLHWLYAYCTSPLYHACFTFNRTVIRTERDFVEYEKPCGCMIYLHNIVLQQVGGFDTDFKKYGYEHVNYSDRIFNAGLTPARYLDILHGSTPFFRMANCESSVPSLTRSMHLYANEKLYNERYHSKAYIPFT